MERLATTRSSYYAICCHLFLSDLVHILEIFKKYGNPEILDNEFRYNNFDEVKNNRGIHPTHLQIQTKDPYINFEFNKSEGLINGFKLHSSNDTKEAKLGFSEIREILQERTTWLGRVFNTPFAHGVLYGILFFVPFRLNLQSITLANKHEIAGFYKRNKDQIMLAIFSALLGALFGSLATYFLHIH